MPKSTDKNRWPIGRRLDHSGIWRPRAIAKVGVPHLGKLWSDRSVRGAGTVRARYIKWTPEDDRQLAQLRATGMKWAVVAKKLRKTEQPTISRAGVLALQAVGRSVEIGLRAKK